MHEKIENFVREEIKKGLSLCKDDQVKLFKRMYSHKNIDKDIDKVVDDMATQKLDTALGQVERTLLKNTNHGKG